MSAITLRPISAVAAVFSLFAPVVTAIVPNQPCTICQNGQQPSLPEKFLSLPGLPQMQCGTIDFALAVYVPNATSSTCTTVQSLGSLCGCPVRSDSCSLCPDGQPASFAGNELPFLSDLFLGYTPTCEILEAYLASQSLSDSICYVSQSFISTYCGCNVYQQEQQQNATGVGSPPCSLCQDGGAFSLPNRSITIPDFPFKTCDQVSDALALLLDAGSEQCLFLSQAFSSFCGCNIPDNSCPLCHDGSTAPYASQQLDLLKDNFGGIVPTCDVFESYVAGLTAESEECGNMQLFGSICGCPAIYDHCEFCPGESLSAAFHNKTVHELKGLVGFETTCGISIDYLQYQLPRTSDLCESGQSYNHVCGCSGGIFSYLEADTFSKQVALAWLPRLSALLSFVGASLIICDVLSLRKRRNAVYSQIMLGMSIFDVVGAFAWALSTAPIPMYNRYGDPTYVYGAIGNNTTCKLQGFMIQLSFTSIFYNIALSIYYLLVIVKGWRDQRLRKHRWWMHGLPITIGFGLAVGGLPFYQNCIFGCHIQSHPVFEPTWYPLIFFTLVPIFLTILITTVIMVRIYLDVRHTSRKASRWGFGSSDSNGIENSSRKRKTIWSRLVSAISGRSSKALEDISTGNTKISNTNTRPRQTKGTTTSLQDQVFWQSILYLGAFYLSWTVLLTAIFVSSPLTKGTPTSMYYFYVITLTLAPLQGFWNCIIYFRPRFITRRQSRRISTPPPARDSFFVAALQWMSSNFPSSVEANYVDPSDQIAHSDGRWNGSSQTSDDIITVADGARLAANVADIQEEMAELEGAENRIDDYIPDDPAVR